VQDEARILVVTGKIQKIWKGFPDLRFGQLVYNIIGREVQGNFVDHLYNMEFDELEELLDLYIEQHLPPQEGSTLYVEGRGYLSSVLTGTIECTPPMKCPPAPSLTTNDEYTRRPEADVERPSVEKRKDSDSSEKDRGDS